MPDQHSVRREVIQTLWEAHAHLKAAHSLAFDLADMNEYLRVGAQLRSLRDLIQELEAVM